MWYKILHRFYLIHFSMLILKKLLKYTKFESTTYSVKAHSTKLVYKNFFALVNYSDWVQTFTINLIYAKSLTRFYYTHLHTIINLQNMNELYKMFHTLISNYSRETKYNISWYDFLKIITETRICQYKKIQWNFKNTYVCMHVHT